MDQMPYGPFTSQGVSHFRHERAGHVVHAYHPSVGKAEATALLPVQSEPGLYSQVPDQHRPQ